MVVALVQSGVEESADGAGRDLDLVQGDFWSQ